MIQQFNVFHLEISVKNKENEKILKGAVIRIGIEGAEGI